jgi:hypothetical protein
LVLWLVTTLPWPDGGPSAPLAGADWMGHGDECRTDGLAPALSLGPARPDGSSAHRDIHGDDRAILDDDGADEEAAPGDGACLAGTMGSAGSCPLLSHPLVQRIATAGGHARRIPELCRYRC